MSTKIIACETVIQEMSPFLPQDMECRSIESGLHIHPEKLKVALQEIIDEITADTKTIILGYGLCSMAAIGLKADHSTLVVPRQDDCVGLFLGSRRRYKEELKNEPGTYFISKGWIDAKITLLDELKIMEERYGKERAKSLMKRMLKHYVRLAFIDMGYQDHEAYREYSRQAAKEFDLSYHEIEGTTEMLEKMVNGPWDDGFVVAPPGHKITMEDFGLI
jgi:hypothetical protein